MDFLGLNLVSIRHFYLKALRRHHQWSFTTMRFIKALLNKALAYFKERKIRLTEIKLIEIDFV